MEAAYPRSILAVVAKAGGPEAARKLQEAAGGTEIYIPKRAAPDHWLVSLIGEAAFAAVLAELGHGDIGVPTGRADAWRRRRQRIAELDAQGKSATEIARAVGCDERTVRRVRSEARP